ncbi:DEAD/DEAH box helicase family protein [Thiothrix litoralis]|uniref:DEAD/DEAH box helicase family protein n=1 Tax=Thiothrix litoralis TaxID=2891210 RepID=A0ABX7WWA7_9GAMM|nr:DEAD/DEAH box helicase family protein [Thiothrix litoralis]QTR47312.1 DEAD/DEAH box helicase family protein [Thiothrix litoralis]
MHTPSLVTPTNLVNVTYAQTSASINTNPQGMRDMQARAFAARDAQYLLLKAPPASGKSRALMFLGLDKLYNQGVKKVIVAVPERSIGSSFSSTKLSEHGFFADWELNDDYNLCTPGGETSKVKAFQQFLDDNAATLLICTHATLRFAFEGLETSRLNNTLLAIDEFHQPK